MFMKKTQPWKLKKKLTCQRCKKTIPSDSNYCSYCSLPIVAIKPTAPKGNGTTEALAITPEIEAYLKRIASADIVDGMIADGVFIVVERI